MGDSRDELRLLLEDQFSLDRPRLRLPAAGSLLYHALVIAAMLLLPAPPAAESPRAIPRKFTPLVAPPTVLTQQDPTRGKVTQELNLAGLLPRPESTPSPPSTAATAPRPSELLRPPLAVPPPSMPEPPQIDTRPSMSAQAPAPGPVTGSPPQIQPPQIQTEERPKLAFEKPGAISTPSGGPRIPAPPRASVDETARGVARGSAGGGVVVGDPVEQSGGLGALLNQTPTPARSSSRLELLSDPMGADFRPYLIRILASVRRNWFAVMPESVRMGRTGQVLVQFAINRDGSVPKLVIAVPSGADALDRAAVAGISASNPFPPLPPEFRGEQVRLQLTFSYNVLKR